MEEFSSLHVYYRFTFPKKSISTLIIKYQLNDLRSSWYLQPLCEKVALICTSLFSRKRVIFRLKIYNVHRNFSLKHRTLIFLREDNFIALRHIGTPG